MRLRPVWAALLAAGLGAGVARAQVPRTVSERLARAWARPDTSVLVWVFGDPATPLDSIAALVRGAGGAVRHESRFLWAVSARMAGDALPRLAGARPVRRIQPVGTYFARQLPRALELRWGTPGGGPCAAARCPPALQAPAGLLPRAALADTTYGPGAWAVEQLDVPAAQRLGLSGAGVRIALLDAGVDTAQPYMAGAHIVAYRDFVGDTLPFDSAGLAHGTATWSLLAANRPGRIVGVAPGADYLLARTEYVPTETRTEEDNWVAAVEWADSLGADVVSSSLGYLSFDNGFTYTYQQLNGDFAVTTIAADSAAAHGILVVNAVGNRGPSLGTLETPADAKGIVAAGATDSLGDVASFSSRGPTADGRIKPEVVAPGVRVRVAAVPTGDTVASGTSFATPLVAGIAALVQQARPGHPAVELRQGLLDAASFRNAPDNNHGWGIPDALAAVAFPTGVRALAPLDSLDAATPTFAWDAGTPPLGAAPDTFELQVGYDSSLVTLAVDSTVTISKVTLPFAIPGGTRIYWRVTARSPLGASETTARTGPLIAPAWATLLTLNAPSGQSIRDSQPLFAWRSPAVTSPPGPFRYDFEVYPASDGPTRPVLAATGLTDTLYRPGAPLERNLPFRWQVIAHLGSADSAVITSTGTFVILDQRVPSTAILFQNFPNPFPNPALGVSSTCFWFDVAQPGNVSLQIYDLRGRLVRSVVPSAQVPSRLDAGRYGRPQGDAFGTCDPRFSWDGRDETGAYARPGVYLYRLTAPGFRDTKRIVFLGAP